jgi:hypothetical protein
MSDGFSNLLHIYPQQHWHDCAVIVGTPSGLIALRDAIDAALTDGKGVADTMTADGEGYEVVVLPANAPPENVEWPYPTPYVDEIAQDHSDAAKVAFKALWQRVGQVRRQRKEAGNVEVS